MDIDLTVQRVVGGLGEGQLARHGADRVVKCAGAVCANAAKSSTVHLTLWPPSASGRELVPSTTDVISPMHTESHLRTPLPWDFSFVLMMMMLTTLGH
jgi:hypothetical protein